MNKDRLNTIKQKISTTFVEDFNAVNISKDKINNYLKSIELEELYDYNTFCSDFILVSTNILDKIEDKVFFDVRIEFFIAEVLYAMIKYKIIKSNKTDDIKTYNLIKLELDKKKILNK